MKLFLVVIPEMNRCHVLSKQTIEFVVFLRSKNFMGVHGDGERSMRSFMALVVLVSQRCCSKVEKKQQKHGQATTTTKTFFLLYFSSCCCQPLSLSTSPLNTCSRRSTKGTQPIRSCCQYVEGGN